MASSLPRRFGTAPILASPMTWDPHENESKLNGGSFPFPLDGDSTTTPSSNGQAPRIKEEDSDLFLGLDLSTQALKALFANSRLEIVASYSVRFDDDLPHYNTTSGVHISSTEAGVVNSPVAMWLEALDLLLERISATIDGKSCIRRTRAVSGAAQQHASVFLSTSFPATLSSLSPSKPMHTQIDPKKDFVLPYSPNWQDSSTGQECRDMEESIGGKEEMAKRTGSRACERFTGPQILKFRRKHPDLYQETDRLCLASSFLTTLLVQDGIQSLEESDACGMNLWNLEKADDWDSDLINYVSGESGAGEATELLRKLGRVTKDGGVAAGKIGKWFVERFAFDSDCIISPFTGDNPSTLLSFSLLTSDLVISLGTSDTVLLSTTEYNATSNTHTFAYPANVVSSGKKQKRSYMGMLCYKNGSLPREWVRDTYASGSWEKFNSLIEAGLEDTQVKSSEEIGFYFLKPEIIPHNGHGIHRFANDIAVEEFKNPSSNALAILSSQFLSMRLRSSKMLASPNGVPNRIFAVGGASSNPTILNTLSSVLGAPIYQPAASSSSINSCALGGCMKAYWTFKRQESGFEEMHFEDCVRAARGEGTGEGKIVARPDLKLYERFGGMLGSFERLEKRTCGL